MKYSSKSPGNTSKAASVDQNSFAKTPFQVQILDLKSGQAVIKDLRYRLVRKKVHVFSGSNGISRVMGELFNKPQKNSNDLIILMMNGISLY